MLKSLNDITPEILSGVEEMAGCFFEPKKIALAMEIDIQFMAEQMQAEDSELYRAFHKGWLNSEFQHRQSIISLAKSGSSPAQTMVTTMLDRAKLKLLDNG